MYVSIYIFTNVCLVNSNPFVLTETSCCVSIYVCGLVILVHIDWLFSALVNSNGYGNRTFPTPLIDKAFRLIDSRTFQFPSVGEVFVPPIFNGKITGVHFNRSTWSWFWKVLCKSIWTICHNLCLFSERWFYVGRKKYVPLYCLEQHSMQMGNNTLQKLNMQMRLQL